MTVIKLKNNQGSNESLGNVNFSNVEFGELLVDVHDGTIGFKNDTGDGWHKLNALPSTTMDGTFPYFWDNKLNALNPGVMFLDGTTVRFGAGVGAERLEVNGWASFYADAGDPIIRGHIQGSGGWEEVLVVVDNEIHLIDGPEGDGCIQYVDGNGKELDIRQGTGQTSNLTIRWPTDSGAIDQVLKTDGSGNLSWVNNVGSGYGTVSVSNETGSLAYYQNAGTTVVPTSASKIKIIGGEILAFADGNASARFTDAVDFSADLKGVTGNIFEINLKDNSGSPQQNYMDINSLTGDPCLRIQSGETVVGTQSKPAIQIGTGNLKFYTDSKDANIENTNLQGSLKFTASNTNQDAVELLLAIGGGKVLANNLQVTGTITEYNGNPVSFNDLDVGTLEVNSVNNDGGNIIFTDDVQMNDNLTVIDDFGVWGNSNFGCIGENPTYWTAPDFEVYGGPATEPSDGSKDYGPLVKGADYSRLTIKCVQATTNKTASENNPAHGGDYDGQTWANGETQTVSGPVLSFESYRYGPDGDTNIPYATRRWLRRDIDLYNYHTIHSGLPEEYDAPFNICLIWGDTGNLEGFLGESSFNSYMNSSSNHSFPTSNFEVGDIVQHVGGSNVFSGGYSYARITDIDHTAKILVLDNYFTSESPQWLSIDIIPKRKDVTAWEIFKQSRDVNGWNTSDFSDAVDSVLEYESLNFKPSVREYSNDSISGSTNYTSEHVNAGVAMRVQANGTIQCAQTFVNGSSREVKQNVEDLSEERANLIIQELQPVTFEYKTTPSFGRLGFIAEDVPGDVAEKNRKGLSSMGIVAALTGAVKFQKTEIDGLKKEIEELKNLIQNLGVN